MFGQNRLIALDAIADHGQTNNNFLLLFRIQGTPKWISPTKTQKIDFRTITINSILYKRVDEK